MNELDFTKYEPKYADWTESDYVNSGLRYCEPMTAHALEDETEQDKCLSDNEFIIEEKFDGTRGILHFLKDGCRVFSRRISKKTNWFTENTDSLPQMRDIIIPELAGTIIDGEMFIPNKPFKDVSSTLNCKWDKAIYRQKELGWVVFHAFDILYYRGIKIEHLSLKRRKVFLNKVFNSLKNYGITCIEEVPYYFCHCGKSLYIPAKNYSCDYLMQIKGVENFPTLYRELQDNNVGKCRPLLSPRGYYEFIVATGGEGVIVKNVKGIYEHKRSKGYLKIKKFYTRECILLGFTEPTKYYDGKFPDDSWEYWETPDNLKITCTDKSAKNLLKQGYKPLTKYYYNNWVGNMIFGVIITQSEIDSLPKGKKFNIHEIPITGLSCKDTTIYKVLEVGECAGFDEYTRERLTFSKDSIIGKVIEVKCNEVFKDTGKLRHPRFLRFRDDKDFTDCTYLNHVTE